MQEEPKKRTDRIRVPLTIAQITVGNMGGRDYVLGLGHNSKVYYYTAEGWKPLAPKVKI